MFILEEETKSIKAIRKLEAFLSWWAALGGGVVAVAADKFLEKSLGKMQIIATALADKTCRKSRIPLLSDLQEMINPLQHGQSFAYRMTCNYHKGRIIQWQ